MIRCIHVADLHFGMENYGRIDPATGIHSRLLDFERAFTECIEYALEQRVDIFLFAGDAYKTAHPTPTHQHLLLSCFLRLFKAGIPVVMVVGNHDHPLSFGKKHVLELFGQLPLDGFHVISKPTLLSLMTRSGPLQIVGIPWPTRSLLALSREGADYSSQDITADLSRTLGDIVQFYGERADPTIPTVLLGHLTVANGIFSGSEKRAVYGTDPIVHPSQLACKPYDYIALGHLHRYQDLNPRGYPSIVYSGSIERIDFGERVEEKGFCEVLIEGKGQVSHCFIPVKTRPFIQIEVHLAGSGFTEQILREIRKHRIDGAVVKLIYHLPADRQERIDLTALHHALSEAHALAGIFPQYTHQIRERRAIDAKSTDFESLLNLYFSNKGKSTQEIERLLTKTVTLQRAHEEITGV